MGEADGDGDFRIQQQPFSSPTCEVQVSDGSTSVTVTKAIRPIAVQTNTSLRILGARPQSEGSFKLRSHG